MFLNIILLIIGFIFLIKGADIFVDGASSTAQNFKMPKILIGLTIVAFGTSAPEFAVSISAIMNNSADMVLGNVIGSNIMNILLIVGIAAIINPLKIQNNTIRKEIPLALLISSLLTIIFLDTTFAGDEINRISRADGLVIILFFTVFVYYLINLAIKRKSSNEEDNTPQFSMLKSIVFVILGIIGIIIGSNLVVNNASDIARTLGLSERLISLTIIAFGTSLPELVTTIVSSKKNEQDLLIGNIIGSNIFNICVVLGIPVSIFGELIPSTFQIIDFIMLIISSAMLFIFSLKDHKISRLEGILMLITFFIYYILVFVI